MKKYAKFTFVCCFLFVSMSAIVCAQGTTSNCDLLILEKNGDLCNNAGVNISNPDCFDHYSYTITEYTSDGQSSKSTIDNSKELSVNVQYGNLTTGFAVEVKAYRSADDADPLTETEDLPRKTLVPTVISPYEVTQDVGTMGLSNLVQEDAGVSLRWYDGADSPNTISEPQINLEVTGSYSYYVQQISNGCESARVKIEVTVLPAVVPDPPVVTNYKDCSTGGTLDLSTLVTATSGATLNFYTTVDGTDAMTDINVSLSDVGVKTYYVSQTLGVKESSRAELRVEILESPQAFAGDDKTICQGVSVQLGTAPQADMTYSWSPAEYLQNPNVSNPSTKTSLQSSTTFTLKVSRALLQTDACTATDDVTVTVVQKPEAQVRDAELSICGGNTVELCSALQESGVAYSWQPASMVQNPDAACTNSVALSSDQQFVLTAALASMPECSSTTNVVVKVAAAAPQINMPSNVSVCSGSSAEIGTAPEAGVTYEWQPADKVMEPASSKTLTVGLQQATSFTLTATSDYSSGCKTTASVLVSVEQLPFAYNLSGGGVLCTGSSVSDGKASLSGSSTLAEYMLIKDGDELSGTWIPGTGSVLEWKNLAPGTYKVKARNMSGSKCEAYMNGSVTVYEVPKPALVSFAASQDVACPKNKVNIRLQFEGEAPFDFDLLVNGYTHHYTADDEIFTFDYEPTRATTMILYGFSDANCSTVLEKPDTVFIAMEDLNAYGVTADPSTILCPGSTITLSSKYKGDDVSYIWSTGDTSESIVVKPATDTQYRLTTITPNGCIVNDTVDIEVRKAPDLYITGLDADSSYCYSDLPFYLEASVKGGIYTVEPETDAITNGGYVDPSKVTTSGTYTVTYSYTDDAGCTTSTTFDMYLYAPIEVDWYVEPDFPPYADSYTYCLPNEAQLQSYTLVGVPTSTDLNGRWTLHSTEASDTYLSNITGGTTNMVNITPGTYNVTYSISDHAGCVNSKTKSITITNKVTQIIDNDSIWAYPNDTICQNTCNEAYIQASNRGGVFSVSGNMDFTVDPSEPARIFLCPANQDVQGNFTAIYSMHDSYGCEVRYRKDFYVRMATTIPAFDLKSDYCESDADVPIKVVTATPTSGTINIYKDGDTDKPIVEKVDPNNSNVYFCPSWGEGDYVIEYAYSDAYCSDVYTQNVSVHSADEITITLDSDYCYGDHVPLTAIPSGGFFSANDPNAIINNILYTEKVGTGVVDITYTTTNKYGCTSSADHTIEIRGPENIRIDNLLDEYCEPKGVAIISAYPTWPGVGKFSGGTWLIDNGNGSATIDLSKLVRSNTYKVTYSYSQDYNKADGEILTCSASATESFKVLDKTATIRGINHGDNICSSAAPITIYGYPYDSAGRGHFEFSLNPAGGFVDNGDGTATITPSVLGDDTYGITYIYEYIDKTTGDVICSSEETITFTVTEMPALPDPVFVCSPDGKYPVMVVPSSLSDATYTMNLSNGTYIETLQGTGKDLSFSPITFNSYLMLSAERNGCISRLKDNIHVSPLAITNVVAQNLSCNKSQDGFIEVKVTGGGYDYEHVIKPQNGMAAIQDSIAYGLSAGTYLYSVTDSMNCSILDRSIELKEPNPIQASLESTNLQCFEDNQGSVVATVSGGTTPYTYKWYKHPDLVSVVGQSAALTNIGAGDYQVKITDRNGCEPVNASELIATITQPEEIVVELRKKVDVVTTGQATGSIDISVSGGVKPYTYNWVGGNIDDSNKNQQDQTGLVAGTYYVSVTDANGCTSSTLVVKIDEPRQLRVKASVRDISCNGRNDGQIFIVIEGGHGPFEFEWTDGSGAVISDEQNVSSLSAGMYVLKLRDTYTGLEFSDTYIITEPSLLTASVLSTSLSTLDCYGDTDGNVDISVGGGMVPYKIEWLGLAQQPADPYTARNLPAGAYTVSITDANGCHTGVEWVISQPDKMNLAMQLTQNRCHNGTEGKATLTYGGGVEPYSFAWTGAGVNNPALPDQTGLWAGNSYTVTMTDANGCREQLTAVMENPELITINETITDVTCNNSSNGTAVLSVDGGVAPYKYKWTDVATSQVLSTSGTITGLAPGDYGYEVSDKLGCVHYGEISITEPDLLTVHIQKTDVLCHNQSNGTANAVVTGGTPVYKYSWLNSDGESVGDTPTVSGLAAGSYNLTVTDANGCTAFANVVINNQLPLSLSYEVKNVSSYGGSDGAIDIVEVSGGTGAGTYTFDWSGGNIVNPVSQNQANLVADEYYVTVVDANSCSVSESIIVTQPERLSVQVEVSDVMCYGGNDGFLVVSSVSGGVLPYSYEWTSQADPSFVSNQRNLNNLVAGTYRLTVRDASGDSYSRNYTVSQPDELTAVFSNSKMEVPCYGDKTATLRILLSGGTPDYKISWQGPDIDPSMEYGNIAGGLGAGTYSVFVSDANGCNVSANAQITQNPQLKVDAEVVDNICYEDEAGSISLQVSGGTGSGTYLFVWNGDGLEDPTAMNQSGLAAGRYSVSVSDANSCSIIKNYEIKNPEQLSLTVDKTDVSCAGEADGSLTAAAIGGVAPYLFKWTNTNTGLSVAGSAINALSPGIYTLEVTDAAGCVKQEDYTITEPTALNAVLTITSVICAGEQNGKAEVSVVAGSGTAPYSYEWRKNGVVVGNGAGLSNLSAGRYDVTVTDAAGCSIVLNGTISEASQIEIFEEKITHVRNTGEFTGAIDLTVRGGSGVYTYSWVKDGIEISTELDIDNLAAGWYYLTVTDSNGCAAYYEVEITEPRALEVNATVVQNSCFGSDNAYIELAVSGGADHVYSWQKGGVDYSSSKDIYNLEPGAYTITINYTGDDLPYVRTFNITEPEQLQISTLSSSVFEIACADVVNGTINIEVTGGTTAYNVSWSGSGLPTTINNPYSVSPLGQGTYRVDVIDANGCLAASTYEITSPQPLKIDYMLTRNLCYGAKEAAIDVTVSGGTEPYSFQWTGTGVVTDAEDQSSLAAGDYYLSVTDANGCSENASFTLADPAPSVAVLSGGGDICIGGSATIDLMLSGPAPYTIVYTDGHSMFNETLNASEYTFEVSPTTDTVYELVSVEDGNGCQGQVSGQAVVKVHSYPLAKVVSYNEDCCLGETVQVELLVANEAPWTIRYTDQNGLESYFETDENNPYIPLRPTAEGENKYKIIGISNAYCSTELSEEISIVTYPRPQLQVRVPSIACVGDELAVTLTATGQGPWTVDYSENDIDYTISMNESPYELLLTPMQAKTNYNFTSITSGQNCVTELYNHNYLVEAEELPYQPTPIEGNNKVCRGSGEHYRIDAVDNADTYEWSLPEDWSIASGTGTNDIWVNIPADAAGGIISVHAVNECGIGLDVSLAVEVDKDFGPNGQLHSPVYVCQRSSMFQLSVDPVQGAEYYEWQLPEGYSIISGDLSSSILVEIDQYAEAGTVTVIPRNRCAEADPIVGFVNIRKLPFAEAGADFATECLNYAQLAAGTADTITGFWSSMRSSEIVFDDKTLPNASVSNLIFGENPFRWEVTDGYCINYDSVSVFNYNPGITYPEVEMETLCADSFKLSAPVPLYGDYRWTLIAGEGEIEDPDSNETMIRELSIKTPNVIRWEVFSAACSNTVDVTIVSHSLDRLTYAGEDTTIVTDFCNLQAKLVNDENISGKWSIVAGSGEFDDPSSPITTVRGLAPGVNTLRWTLSGYGCEAWHEIKITTVDEPVADFSADVLEGCRPLSVTFINRTIGEATYSWDFDDGGSSSVMSPTHVFEDSGLYDVKLVATGKNRVDSATVRIFVYPHLEPEFYATNTQLYLPYAEAHFFDQTEGATSYYWDFGDGGTSTERSPIHNYEKKGLYDVKLIVTNDYSCKDSLVVEKYISVDNDGFVVFPNAFTPDLSQANGGYYELNERRLDIFYPASRNVDTYKLEIYNQWGVKVFESNDILHGWDGYYLGKCASQGTYSYLAEGKYKNGVVFRYSGSFLLIR